MVSPRSFIILKVIISIISCSIHSTSVYIYICIITIIIQIIMLMIYTELY